MPSSPSSPCETTCSSSQTASWASIYKAHNTTKSVTIDPEHFGGEHGIQVPALPAAVAGKFAALPPPAPLVDRTNAARAAASSTVSSN